MPRIILVFRRKNSWKGDNIIAASSLNESELPKSFNDLSNMGIKKIANMEHSSKSYKPRVHLFAMVQRDRQTKLLFN